jgi:hypothetical protein
MIDTDKKYEGHTPANEWRLVFTEGRLGKDKQMLGFSIEVHDLHQLQACDPDLYLIAEANHALAQDAPLLLAEVKRLSDDNKKLNDAINGCAYANMQGSALDLYCDAVYDAAESIEGDEEE